MVMIYFPRATGFCLRSTKNYARSQLKTIAAQSPAPEQTQAPGIEEEDLASLRRQIRHEEEKSVAGSVAIPKDDGAHLTGGVGSEHQPEEITRGPLMDGLASIDVDAWWDRRALITSARPPAGTLPRVGGGQSRG